MRMWHCSLWCGVSCIDEVGCADSDACEETCQLAAGCTNIAYPLLVIRLLPAGARGLMLAVMMSALMSSLTSVFNSSSTIFTVDVWTRLRPHASDVEIMVVSRSVTHQIIRHISCIFSTLFCCRLMVVGEDNIVGLKQLDQLLLLLGKPIVLLSSYDVWDGCRTLSGLWNSSGLHEYLLIYSFELKSAFAARQLFRRWWLTDTSYNKIV